MTEQKGTRAISYQTQRGHTYGTICYVKRNGKKVDKTYGAALGRVLDRERHVFYRKDRGAYCYDVKNDAYLPAPEGIEVPQRKPRMKKLAHVISYVFADVYLLDAVMKNIGFYPLIEEAYADKADSVKAMLSFYIVSALSNCYAKDWYETSYASRLFPSAALSSTQVTELLKYVGEPSRQQEFFCRYLQWFGKKYQKADLGNILIDSTGLPNSVHFSLTAISNHNGEIHEEVHLIYVVQQSTGLPIYFRYIPGNIIDVNTLKRTVLELKQMGVDTNYAITDAGYMSEENIDAFYKASISFLTRLQPNRCLYKSLAAEHLPELQNKGVLVRQRDRIVRVLKVPCNLNREVDRKGNVVKPGYPAYAYICSDEQKGALERLKMIGKVAEGKVNIEDYDESLRQQGIFILVSKRSINPSKVIELYYTRQQIEQVFDFGKNYSGLLPLNIQKEETFRGHLVFTFIATVIIKVLIEKISSTHRPIKPTLENLRTQVCTKFKDLFITSEPNKITREAYAAAGVEYPVQLCA